MDRAFCDVCSPWRMSRRREGKRNRSFDGSPMLQKQIADFMSHTVKENQEWIMGTSYIARHRLKDIAIENRRAAIKGLPEIEDERAEKIMKVILAMRGISKKKQIEMWKEGKLQVTPQKLRTQGTAHG